MTIDFATLRRRLPSLAQVIRDAGLTLTPQGSRLFARCPWHEDGSPSFSVFADGERCGCPPCAWDGDVFEFVQRFFDLPDAASAARWLCERYAVELHPPKKRETKRGQKIEHYDYVDADGEPVFRVTRYGMVYDDGSAAPGKTFLQGRYMGGGKFSNSMQGVEYVLYRLPAILAATGVIWLCEGERDVHAVELVGGIATTDAGGAGARNKFVERGYPEQLRGRHVIVVPDTDAPGQERGALIAHALHGVAESVRIAAVPAPHKDIRDYLEAGGTLTALEAAAVPYTPAAVPQAEPEPKPRQRRAEAAATGTWRDGLLQTGTGQPKPILANVITALRSAPQWQDVLWYNDFAECVVARRPHPGAEDMAGEREWTDAADVRLADWLNHNGINVSMATVAAAVQTVAMERRFHPVREFLLEVEPRWDGLHRIDTWLQRYVGAPNSKYISTAGACWLVSAVARVMEPGAKADCALVLEGAQGIRKSTAVKVLGGEWYTDEIAELGTKDSAIQLRGAWIIEIAELASLKDTGIDRLKAFMSRGTDRYRPPYGRRTESFPRQCVFAGTVNDAQYLKDATGGRRFWPIICGRIDIDGLEEEREQIWAEAVHRYRTDRKWWLTEEDVIAEAEAAQAARYDGDPWESGIEEWLRARKTATVHEVLEHAIGKPMGQWSQHDKNRVAKVLKALKWERYRSRNDEGREWRYRPGPRAVQEPLEW